MFESTTQVRVRYAETDQMNVVYYGNYAQYFEVGRVESMRQLGLTYKGFEEVGIIMPVIEMNVRYLRPATYDDLLTIKTQVREIPVGHRIQFHSEVYNEQNKLLATGNIVLYFLDKNNWKRVNTPENLMQALQPFFE